MDHSTDFDHKRKICRKEYRNSIAAKRLPLVVYFANSLGPGQDRQNGSDKTIVHSDSVPVRIVF